MPERKKRHPLPKRFSAALSEPAYERLRALNAEYGFGNNYLLTFLLENLDQVVKPRELDRMYRRMIAEYGSPEADAPPEAPRKRH